MPELTPEAHRAARAILNWSVQDLANRAGMAISTIENFETTGAATDLVKQEISAIYAAHNVEIIDDNGTGAKLLRPAQSSDRLERLQADPQEQTSGWSPVRGADGRTIPLTYDYVFTDDRETVIGQWREEDEAEPVSVAWLKSEVTDLARKIARAHPSENPWSGWGVAIIATGLRDEPVEVAAYSLQELLD